MSTAPPLTQDQRLSALAEANRIRTTRAATKRHLARLPKPSAYELVIRLVEAPTPELEQMPVRELLGALPRVGPARIQRFLLAAQVADGKRLGGLTDRQRRLLVAVLRGAV